MTCEGFITRRFAFLITNRGFETFVFRADTLALLDRFHGRYDEATLFAPSDIYDLAMSKPIFLDQRFLITCTKETNHQPFTLTVTDRAGPGHRLGAGWLEKCAWWGLRTMRGAEGLSISAGAG